MADIESLLKEKRVFKPRPRVRPRGQLEQAQGGRSCAPEARQARARKRFWARMAKENVSLVHRSWKKTLEWKPPFAKWFVGGKTERLLQLPRSAPRGRERLAAQQGRHHLGGRARRQRVLTFGQLHREVCKFANVLKALGVKKGDRVALYMPMVPELAIAMLACTRIGAPHSIVFGGFSAEALRDRINDAGAKLVVTADGGYRRGEPCR